MARALAAFRRCGFRHFVIGLGVLYFLAMYIFHQDLQGSGRGPSRDGWDRVEIGADAGVSQRHQPTQHQRNLDLQEAFDSMQKNEQDNLVKRFDRRDHEEKAKPEGKNKPDVRINPVILQPEGGGNWKELPLNPSIKYANKALPESLDDVNIPSGCSRGEESSEFLFQRIASEVFVFSAFWDSRPNDFDNRRNGSFIRVMAIIRSNARPELGCYFDTVTESSPSSSMTYYEMCENHGRIYGGFILSCPVPPSLLVPTCSVTIAAVREGRATESVRVRVRTLNPVPQRRKFTICVPPLFGSVSSSRLIEFLEVSRILGAEHVTLYDFEMANDVRAVLHHYVRTTGFVSVVPWRLERSIDDGIWYHGQLISIQDCLYRSMASATYVAFNDIDEFIVPQNSLHWSGLLQVLDRPNRCAFQFKCAFFKPGLDEMEMGAAETELDLQTQIHVERTSNFDRVRTKCMVKAFSIFEKGIHHVSKPIWANLEVHAVDSRDAFLHHYRVCLHGMGMNCNNYETDKTMLKFKSDIISAVRSMKGALKGVL